MGQWLDQELLDPLGSWHCLLAARSALPQWDWLWTWAAVRSLRPMEEVNAKPLPLIYGPLATVLAVCGFVPLVQEIGSSLTAKREGVKIKLARSVLLMYCIVLLVSYPLSYEDWADFYKIGGVRYDRIVLGNLTSQ